MEPPTASSISQHGPSRPATPSSRSRERPAVVCDNHDPGDTTTDWFDDGQGKGLWWHKPHDFPNILPVAPKSRPRFPDSLSRTSSSSPTLASRTSRRGTCTRLGSSAERRPPGRRGPGQATQGPQGKVPRLLRPCLGSAAHGEPDGLPAGIGQRQRQRLRMPLQNSSALWAAGKSTTCAWLRASIQTSAGSTTICLRTAPGVHISIRSPPGRGPADRRPGSAVEPPNVPADRDRRLDPREHDCRGHRERSIGLHAALRRRRS